MTYLNSSEHRLKFINIFSSNTLQFNDKKFSVCNHKFLNSKALKSCTDSLKLKIFNNIIDLIQLLESSSLFFKNHIFPFEEFGYYKGRLVYLFKSRLSNLIQYRYWEKEQILLKKNKTLKNLKRIIQDYHSDYLKIFQEYSTLINL